MAVTFTGIARFSVVPPSSGKVFALNNMGARELIPAANEHHVSLKLPGVLWSNGVLTVDTHAAEGIITEVYVGIELNPSEVDLSRTPLDLRIEFGRSQSGTLSVPQNLRPGNTHAILARALPTKTNGVWTINRLVGNIAFPDRAALIKRCASASW